MDNLSFNIATANGTGSLSANQLLTKILFRSGWGLGSYNFFPSNIAGLPCVYNLRLNSKGWTGFSNSVDVLISLNAKTVVQDIKELKKGGLLVSDKKDKAHSLLNPTQTQYDLPFTQSLQQIQGLSFKTRFLFKNMIYVGLVCEWLKVEDHTIQQTLEDFFAFPKSHEMIKKNKQAIEIGRGLAVKHTFPFSLPKKYRLKHNTDILIDGNSSSALGALFAGCQFVSWYPITPASSLAENFQHFANLYQKDSEGKKKFTVIQAEDELAGITQAIGAGWAGLRAMTVSSGPGLSLMSEGAGLSYWAEIPLVLYNVSRAGPSTGLPTRTQQGDLLSACFLSHGDSKHIVLLPGTPEEAFKLTAQAFDLAEELQTLVIVLSDLDLGLNLKISPEFKFTHKTLKRGKLLKEKDLDNKNFIPYRDENKDGLSYRTLPGIAHPKGAYLNRGSGHNQRAEYSEQAKDYTAKLDKLERKWQTAKTLMPEPVIELKTNTTQAFVTFGSNQPAVKELINWLETKHLNFMRVRSFPFPQAVEDFLKQQKKVFVVEQNRDGQLKRLLAGEFPQQSHKLKSLLQYDGRPLNIENLKKQVKELLK